jgi:small subunit ribosomal protein S1
MDFEMKKVKVGMVVEGKVFYVTDESVYVDLKAFSEGVIHKKALTLGEIDSCKDVVKEGDMITAKIRRIDQDNQQILLSRIDILRDEKRNKFGDAVGKNERIKVKVKLVTKGGLVVMHDGVEMFMPLSQIDTKRIEAADFENKTLECTIIETGYRKIIVSRKRLLEEDLKVQKEEEFKNFKLGQVIEGKVVRVVAFGAFVSIGITEGLVHISQISHHQVAKVSDVLTEGETVKVEIIRLEKNRVALSIKKLIETPWQLYSKEHKVGDKITGKIIRKMAKGMLVEVSKDVIGMISSYDYSWDPKTNLAGEVEVGDQLELQIVSLDPEARKMGLSKKHLSYNPWNDVTVKMGEEVSGIVEEIQTRGALVKVQGVKAFLPIGEISAQRVEKVSDVLKFEEVIKVLVLEVDKREWKMVVSIKQLLDEKQKKEFADYLKTEEKAKTTTIGDLFGEKLKDLK